MKNLIFIFLLAFAILNNGIQAQNTKKEWSFMNQGNGLKKHYKQGQRIAVKWRGESRTIRSKGILVDIETDSLKLIVDKRPGAIAKKDIVAISRLRRGPGLVFLSALLVVAGIAIVGLAILIQLVYNLSRTDSQLAAGEQKQYWPWAFLGIGVIALGFMSLRLPTARMEQPFGPNWAIQEKVEQPNEMP